MMLAPQPTLTASVRQYGSGLRGVAQTLAVMRGLVTEGRRDPVIRQAATTAIFLTPERFDECEVAALLRYVQGSIRYTRDIWDVETVSSAEKTLLGRLGDCDDQSVLLASLCEAVGYPTRFVVAGYNMPGVMEHVYIQVLVNGHWCDADPTERYALGEAPPDAVCVMFERV